ncbi:MAG: sulfotransferase family protein [Candidatus Thorarchaeota archaeon]
MENILEALFVVGAPRSGTKLLCGILNNHNSIMLASEFDSHAKLLKDWDGRDPYKDFDRFYHDLSLTGYHIKCEHRGISISKHELFNHIQGLNTASALLEYLRLIVSSSMQKQSDTTIIGQKSPHLTNNIDVLHYYYPDAKYIHIVRDVRNCAVSSKNAWNTNIYRYSQRWYDKVVSFNNAVNEIGSNKFITIKYEDVITNPDEIIQNVCDFIGVIYDPQMKYFDKPTEYYGGAKGYKSIQKQDSNKFRRILTDREISKIESITFPLLEKYDYNYGYDGKLKHLSPQIMRLMQVQDVINRLLFDVRNDGFRNLIYILRRNLAHFRK